MKQEEAIRVRYIGPKPQWRDKTSLYGSGLDFEKGQVREVPAKLGRSFLRHADLFERASNAGRPPTTPKPDDTQEKLAQAKKGKDEQNEAMHQRFDLMARIEQMDRSALMEYAKTNYRQSLKATDSTQSMRDQVKELVDRFGIVGGIG